MSGPPTRVERDVMSWLGFAPHSIDELRYRLNVPRRDIEAAVEALRLRGEPIIGGASGLHLTSDPSELREYVNARRRRALSIFRGSRALRHTVTKLQHGDGTLFGKDVAA